MEKSEIINAIQGRLDKLEEQRAKDDKKKGGKKQKEDEEVCPECGGNLLFVEEGIVFCPKCEQYFEIGEEKEK